VTACCEWLEAASVQLEEARPDSTDSDADQLMDKLGSVKVCVICCRSHHHHHHHQCKFVGRPLL